MTREWMEPQAVLAEDGRAVAAFCSAADAALFARAARKLYGRELAAMEPEDTPEVEAEEPMDIAALLAQEDAPETAAEAAWKELAFPVYYERRQLLFPVAAFAEEALQALASALFAQFAGDGAAYPTARGASCLAPLQMATQEFLAAYEDRAGQSGEDAPQPYDAAVAFLARAARERPLADERTELEEFLAQTSFRVHRRDFPRWKDIFHLAIKRLKAAEEYAERRVQPVAEEELDAFLAAYQTKREEQKHQAEAATCRLSEGSKEQHFSQTAENGSFAGEEERRLADGIDGFVGTEGTERTEGMDGRNAGTGADGSISRRALRRTHKVLVDADACPVVRLIEKLCERYDGPVALFCDRRPLPQGRHRRDGGHRPRAAHPRERSVSDRRRRLALHRAPPVAGRRPESCPPRPPQPHAQALRSRRRRLRARLPRAAAPEVLRGGGMVKGQRKEMKEKVACIPWL